MHAALSTFLAKWALVPGASQCPGGKRRLVFHWEGEEGIDVQPLSTVKGGVVYGGPRPVQPLKMGPFEPYDNLRFYERRVFAAVMRNVIVEGRDSIIHDGCRIFLPVHGRYIPLHDQLILPEGMEVNYVTKYDVTLQKALFISQMAGENYYHFLAECLPRLFLLREALPEQLFDSLPVIVPAGKAFVEQYLLLLGIEPMRIIRHNNTARLHVAELHTVDWRPTDERPDLQFYAPRRGLQLTRDALRGRLSHEAAANLHRQRPAIVYVSRNDTSHRHVRNEWQLLASLRHTVPHMDVVAYVGGNSTGQRALELFSRAVVVIGSHGAGLGNIMLCRPGSVLIEFALPSPQMRYYAHLATALDLLYDALPLINKFREDISVDPGAVALIVKSWVHTAIERGWKM